MTTETWLDMTTFVCSLKDLEKSVDAFADTDQADLAEGLKDDLKAAKDQVPCLPCS